MTSNSDNKVAIFQANIKREDGSKLSAPKVEDIIDWNIYLLG